MGGVHKKKFVHTQVSLKKIAENRINTNGIYKCQHVNILLYNILKVRNKEKRIIIIHINS